MGRRPKYLTLAEKDAGAGCRKKELASTPRGQLLRKYQNQRAYQLRKASAPPKAPKLKLPVFSTPSFSAALVALADFPTPQSQLFRLALESSGALKDTDYSDTELAKWDCAPPYNCPAPLHPDRLADTLHGYRRRCQYEEENRRLRRYETEPLNIFATEVHAELVRRHDGWKKLQATMVNVDHESIHSRLGMDKLQWEARRICHLEKDLASLRKGSDAFLCLYVDRWS